MKSWFLKLILTLVNKKGTWMSTDTWTLPDKEGKITNTNQNNEVLTVNMETGKVTLETAGSNDSPKQQWKREYNDNKTFFSLRNTAVNQMDLYLTASDDATLKVQAAISWTFPRGGVAGVIRNENEKKVLENNGGEYDYLFKVNQF